VLREEFIGSSDSREESVGPAPGGVGSRFGVRPA